MKEITTYFGEQDNSIFKTSIDFATWSYLLSYFENFQSDFIEFIEYKDINKMFYPIKKKCIKLGNIIKIDSQEYSMKIERLNSKEIDTYNFSSQKHYDYKWKIERTILNLNNVSELFFDNILNIDKNNRVYRVILKGVNNEIKNLILNLFEKMFDDDE